MQRQDCCLKIGQRTVCSGCASSPGFSAGLAGSLSAYVPLCTTKKYFPVCPCKKRKHHSWLQNEDRAVHASVALRIKLIGTRPAAARQTECPCEGLTLFSHIGNRRSRPMASLRHWLHDGFWMEMMFLLPPHLCDEDLALGDVALAEVRERT